MKSSVILASSDIRGRVKSRITTVSANLTKAESSVLSLLTANWNDGNRITQRDIADSLPWLGCHPKHEAGKVAKEYETTTRCVRKVVRDLREKHKIPVLSDPDGYFLPTTDEAAMKYLDATHRQAKARAAASMATYYMMCQALGFQGEFVHRIGVK